MEFRIFELLAAWIQLRFQPTSYSESFGSKITLVPRIKLTLTRDDTFLMMRATCPPMANHLGPHTGSQALMFSINTNFLDHLAVLDADTGKSECEGYFNVGQSPIMRAFCNLDSLSRHYTYSFRLSGVGGSNCDCTVTYYDMTPERRKCAARKAQ
jgi:hypothetical protein